MNNHFLTASQTVQAVKPRADVRVPAEQLEHETLALAEV